MSGTIVVPSSGGWIEIPRPGAPQRANSALSAVLVSNRCDVANTALSSGSAISGTYRNGYRALVDASAIRLYFANRRLMVTTGEVAPPFPYTIKATFETPGGALLPVLFGGVREVSIAIGADLLSDPLPVSLEAGDTFFVRSRPLMPVLTDTWLITGGANLGTLEGGGGTSGDTVDNASSSFVGAGGFFTAVPFGPSAIIGVNNSAPQYSAIIMGDSIGYGSGDVMTPSGDYGFLARICSALRVPHMKEASPSLAFAHFLGTTDADLVLKTVYTRSYLDRFRPSHVVICMGNNNVHAADTLEVCQAGFLRWAEWFASMGLKIVCTTISPRTTGTWTTLNGQTESAAGLNTKRRAFNSWLRRKPHSAITTVIDLAAAVEDPVSFNKWRVDGGAHTGDGTHPNLLGHTRAETYALTAGVVF